MRFFPNSFATLPNTLKNVKNTRLSQTLNTKNNWLTRLKLGSDISKEKQRQRCQTLVLHITSCKLIARKIPDLHEQKHETNKPQNKSHGWQSLAQGSCVCKRNPSNSTGSLLGADRRIVKDYAENAEMFKQTFIRYLERRMVCFHCLKMMKYFPVY